MPLEKNRRTFNKNRIYLPKKYLFSVINKNPWLTATRGKLNFMHFFI